MDNISKFKEILVRFISGSFKVRQLFSASKEMYVNIIVLLCVGNCGSTGNFFIQYGKAVLIQVRVMDRIDFQSITWIKEII